MTKQNSPSKPNAGDWQPLLDTLQAQREEIHLGGGVKATDRQHGKNRQTARERIAALIDPETEFNELGTFAAFGMYGDWGGAPCAGVVCGIGRVAGRSFMIIANDATVKAGAFFPQTAKKVLRCQTPYRTSHNCPRHNSHL